MNGRRLTCKNALITEVIFLRVNNEHFSLDNLPFSAILRPHLFISRISEILESFIWFRLKGDTVMATKAKAKKQDVAMESEFGKLLKDFFQILPKVGDIVSGTVISVGNGIVRLDIQGMTTGIVRGRELFGESSEFSNIKPGDVVEATIIEQENENGEMELSFRSAGHQKVWDRMTKMMQDGLTLTAKVLQANKGGLMMQVDAISGFMPVSQLSPENYPRVPGGEKNRILEKLRELIGKDMQVKVIDVNQKEEKLIVSQKAVWEDEQKAVLDSYKIGDSIKGEVAALTSFGAFVKFGEGLEGLVHISEIAWQRIDHPKDVLKLVIALKLRLLTLTNQRFTFQ